MRECGFLDMGKRVEELCGLRRVDLEELCGLRRVEELCGLRRVEELCGLTTVIDMIKLKPHLGNH